MGIGGSVIFSTLRGQTERKGKVENEYFTTAVIGAAVLSVIAWLAILFFEKPILLFFGADINLLSLAQTYLEPIKVVVPFFLFNQMLAAFLRNDGNPGLATAGVLAGGLFNVFGDYIFVFTFDMGILRRGACHGDRLRHLVLRHAVPLLVKEKYTGLSKASQNFF
mgnify:FL=1